MQIIQPSYEILNISHQNVLQFLESIGRVCYKSEHKITNNSCIDFVKMLLKNKHESVLEHVSITVKLIIDRGISHELVRHRIASFTQESTRYCNYGKFNQLTFIEPCFLDKIKCDSWLNAMTVAENEYLKMIRMGNTPQEARSILPNSLKTELIMTANLREWRHIFKVRTSKEAHPQMQEIMIPLLKEIKTFIPLIFDNIN